MKRKEPVRLSSQYVEDCITYLYGTAVRDKMYECRLVDEVIPRVLGSLACHARVVKYEHYVLQLQILSSAMKQNMMFKRDEYIRAFNQTAGREMVRELILL